jgi:hypothetical protein
MRFIIAGNSHEFVVVTHFGLYQADEARPEPGQADAGGRGFGAAIHILVVFSARQVWFDALLHRCYNL